MEETTPAHYLLVFIGLAFCLTGVGAPIGVLMIKEGFEV